MIILKVYGKGDQVTDIQVIMVHPAYSKTYAEDICKQHTSQVKEKYWTYALIIDDDKKYDLLSIYEMFCEHVNNQE